METNSKTTLKTPITKEIVGTLVSIDTLDSGIVLLNVQNVEDEIQTIATSEAYWRKVGKLYQADAIVKASYEVRIEGVTGYTPEGSEEPVAHKSSGNNLSSISRFSSLSFQRMLDSQSKEADISVINAVEPERVNAVAQYLSSYVRK